MAIERGSSVRGPLMAIAVAALLVSGWVGVRGALQFRAYYPGGLTFVGNAEGLTGVRYVRFFMWKAPDYADGLPDMTLVVASKSYAISELSAESIKALGGVFPQGAVLDSTGNSFEYRFENGRLTWISLTPPFRPTTMETTASTGGNVWPGEFGISISNGPVFTMPVTLDELREWAGPPASTGQHFAN